MWDCVGGCVAVLAALRWRDGQGMNAPCNARRQVRGKDFRHEKTKKKRGSYKGGLIDSGAICSYKFESDDE